MDDGLQGDLKLIYDGIERTQIITDNIFMGRQYRL